MAYTRRYTLAPMMKVTDCRVGNRSVVSRPRECERLGYTDGMLVRVVGTLAEGC